MFTTATLAILTALYAPVGATMHPGFGYGKPFSPVNPIPLAILAELAKEKIGKKVQIWGPVHQVCAKKGCWMTIADGSGTSVRITFKDYSFFMPTSLAEGTVVVAKGILESRELSEAQIEHMKKEGAKGTKNTELRLVAEGVRVFPSRR